MCICVLKCAKETWCCSWQFVLSGLSLFNLKHHTNTNCWLQSVVYMSRSLQVLKQIIDLCCLPVYPFLGVWTSENYWTIMSSVANQIDPRFGLAHFVAAPLHRQRLYKYIGILILLTSDWSIITVQRQRDARSLLCSGRLKLCFHIVMALSRITS